MYTKVIWGKMGRPVVSLGMLTNYHALCWSHKMFYFQLSQLLSVLFYLPICWAIIIAAAASLVPYPSTG